MRIRTLWLLPGLMAALIFVGMSEAQPPGKKGGKDKKGGPPRVEDRDGPREGFGGFGGPGGLFALQRALDDLNLSGKKKEQTEAIVKAHQEISRKLIELAHSDMILKMQEILNEEEFKSFKVALDRPPGRRGRGDAGRRGISADEIVERIMSFDKNKDGKVTKDELPERMQDLITKGDTNKDGALDKEEIKKLAADLSRDQSFRGFDGRDGPGGDFRRAPFGRGGPPGGFPPGGGLQQRALDELKLSDSKRDRAEAAVRADRENVRKLTDLARSDLLLKMKEVLNAEEFKRIKAATDRPSGPGGTPRTADLERKLDQLQKDLEDLRRELRR